MRAKLLGTISVLALGFGLTSCASVDLPRRGFLTRYFAGSALQDSARTTDDLVGRPLQSPINTYVGAAAAAYPAKPVSARMSTTLAQTVQECALSAHQRALDLAFQGFGDQTQRTVYDSTYAGCISWHTNH
jgi:hypothetical protein